jgi:hypothetical protein
MFNIALQASLSNVKFNFCFYNDFHLFNELKIIR